MHCFLFALLLLSQAYELVPIIGKLDSHVGDGIGDDARFGGITAMWNVGPDLYIADGLTIRKLNLQSREVSTVTVRAGTGRRINTPQPLNGYTGIADLWSDGTYLYATDIGSGTIRRILLSTGEVEDFSSTGFVSWGLTGTADSFFVADARRHELMRIDRATRTSQRFLELSLPMDPNTCRTGSGCLNYYVPSPRDLWSDGKYIYATGLNTSIRRIEIATGAETNLPALPLIPGTITGDESFVYINFGQEIGRQNLATGEYQTISRSSTLDGSGYSGIVAYDGGIYTSMLRGIIRIDIGTGAVTQVAGIVSPRMNALWREGDSFFGYNFFGTNDRRILKINVVSGETTVFAGSGRWTFTDGVGTDADFINLQGMWGDGSYLYVGDGRGIRRVNLSNAEVTTLTGGPDGDPQGGPAATARLGSSAGIWGVGDYLYVTDYALWLIYKIDKRNGEVSAFAGGPLKSRGYLPGEGPGYVDGPGAVARFSAPSGIWSDGSLLYVTDNDKIRTISVATAEVRTLTTIPNALLSYITGIGDDLFVTGAGGTWRVSRSTGNFERIIDAGTGPTRGFILRPNAVALNAYSGSVFVSSNGVISRLDSRPLPTDMNFRLNAAGSTEWKTLDDAPLTLGYGFIDRGAEAASGMAIYANRQNGAIVSETSVPLSPLISEGRIYASVKGSVNTGIAIANPSDLPANMTFYFTDEHGHDFGKSTFTLAAHQQIAKFLNEAPFSQALPTAGTLFGAESIQGTFTFNSSVEVGAIALRGLTNERSEFLMTTLPIAPLSTGAMSSAILPHYAAGGGWTTEVILVNTTDASISGTLDFQTTMPYTIPPRSSRVFTSTDSSSTMTGSVTVTPLVGGAPVTSGIFSFRKNGVTVTSAGVPEVKPSTAFEVFQESEGKGSLLRGDAGTMGTGIAVSNPGASPLTVHVEQYELNGVPTGRFGVLTIPAHGHVAAFVEQIPHGSADPTTYMFGGLGRIRLWTDSGSGFSVIGLRARYNERGDFLITSTPALADDAPTNTGPRIFPHFAEGGGYTTEFVLMNRTVGAVATGTVRYFSQSGEPAAIPLQ